MHKLNITTSSLGTAHILNMSSSRTTSMKLMRRGSTSFVYFWILV